MFAREARKQGTRVIGFAIKEMASPEFGNACDRVHWISLGDIKKFLFLFLVERIKKVVLLGKINKSIIYSSLPRDEEAERFLKDSADTSDYALLDGITRGLAKRGIEVIDGVGFLRHALTKKGVLTKRVPSEQEAHDIRFGFTVARELARFDIGQTVVIKNRNVISVEALEGTDRAIERAADLCGEGFVVVKAARPKQDMRWDVPVVGPETVERVAVGKGKVLALEAEKMFLVEKDACVHLADNNDISLVVV